MAYVRNLPKRFSVKLETCSGEPGGSRLPSGISTTRTSAIARSASRSGFGTTPARREQASRPALQEQDDGDQDRHLREDGAQRRLDALVEAADAGGGQDRAEQLADAAGDDDHERVHDVVLAERGADVADL